MSASPYATGLTALSRRSHSTSEIVAILKNKGFEEEAVGEAIERLTQDGYLNDERYAQNLAKTYRDRAKSALYIRHKLRERGLDDNVINHALSTNDGEAGDRDSIRRILARKYPEITGRTATRELKQKAYKYLTSNGFRIDDVTKFLRGMDYDERQ
jgi:regulatory protein